MYQGYTQYVKWTQTITVPSAGMMFHVSLPGFLQEVEVENEEFVNASAGINVEFQFGKVPEIPSSWGSPSYWNVERNTADFVSSLDKCTYVSYNLMPHYDKMTKYSFLKCMQTFQHHQEVTSKLFSWTGARKLCLSQGENLLLLSSRFDQEEIMTILKIYHELFPVEAVFIGVNILFGVST